MLEPSEHLRDGISCLGIDKVGGDSDHRLQDEKPIISMGMRNSQTRGVHDLCTKIEQVEIDLAILISARAMVSFPSQSFFDIEK